MWLYTFIFGFIPAFLIAVYTYSLLSELKEEMQTSAHIRANRIKKHNAEKRQLTDTYNSINEERDSNGGRSVSGGDS